MDFKLFFLMETAKLKIRQNLYRVHVCMAILFIIGGKPPNLMTANISGYTVYTCSTYTMPLSATKGRVHRIHITLALCVRVAVRHTRVKGPTRPLNCSRSSGAAKQVPTADPTTAGPMFGLTDLRLIQKVANTLQLTLARCASLLIIRDAGGVAKISRAPNYR